MRDQRDDMEAAGFAEPDEPGPWTDLTASTGVSRWTATRIQMIDALPAVPLLAYLTLDAISEMADVILARLPEASPDARDAELAAALARLRELTGALPGDPGWSLDASTDGPPVVPPPLTAEVHVALLAEIGRLRELLASKDGEIAMLRWNQS